MNKRLFLIFLAFLSHDLFAQINVVGEPALQSQALPLSKEEEEKIYDTPEIRATYSGGYDRFLEYIAQQFIVPASYDERIHSGIVYVEFLVRNDGSITDVKILKGSTPEIDSLILFVFQKMPNWIPAKQRGFPVNSRITTPVHLYKYLQKSNVDVQVGYESNENEALEPPTIPEEKKESKEDIVYDMILKRASFPGGETAMNAFIEKHLRYPESLFINRKDETVEIMMKILEDGSISDIKVKSSTNDICDKYAIEVVEKMPNWEPAQVAVNKEKAMFVEVSILFTPNKETEKIKRKMDMIVPK